MWEGTRIPRTAYVYRDSPSPMFRPLVRRLLLPLGSVDFLPLGWKLELTRYRCKALFNHPQPPPKSRSSAPGAGAGQGGGGGESSRSRASRGGGGGGKIGSDAHPLDLAYYDVLGLDSQCTADEVKKAYRRLAIKVRSVPMCFIMLLLPPCRPRGRTADSQLHAPS